MKPIIQLTLSLTLLTLTLIPAESWAQPSGGVGGGIPTEADLKEYITRIDKYLLTDEGKDDFPEIVDYDHFHPYFHFHDLIKQVHPKVVDAEQKDPFGNPVVCAGYVLPARAFVCNSKELPHTEQERLLYLIVFHELLVQAGLETPISAKLQSDYPISNRLGEHMHPTDDPQANYKWELGRPLTPILKDGLWCYSNSSLIMGSDHGTRSKSHLLFWLPDGRFVFMRYFLPDRKAAATQMGQWMKDRLAEHGRLDILHRGMSPLPRSEKEALFIPELMANLKNPVTLNSVRKNKHLYCPLHEETSQTGKEDEVFFLVVAENLLLKNATNILSDKGETLEQNEIWSYANATVYRARTTKNALVSAPWALPMNCEALSSWKDDEKFPLFPKIEEIFNTQDKNSFRLNLPVSTPEGKKQEADE